MIVSLRDCIVSATHLAIVESSTHIDNTQYMPRRVRFFSIESASSFGSSTAIYESLVLI